MSTCRAQSDSKQGKKKNTSCSLRLAKKRERGAEGRERGRGYDSKAKEEMGKGMKGGG